MTIKKLLAATAVAALAAGAAQAATVNVSSITGVWSSVTPDPGTTGLTGVGLSQVSWGNPTNADGTNPNLVQSSYEFNAVATPLANVASPFQIGTFVHNNFAITGTPITSATLDVTVSGDVNGVAFTLTEQAIFDHFETPNNGSPCAAGGSQPCPDLVTLVNQAVTGATVIAGNQSVSLQIDGFPSGLTFLTNEGQANSAALSASFTVATVPLPAAGWMLVAGLGGIAAVKRRKQAA